MMIKEYFISNMLWIIEDFNRNYKSLNNPGLLRKVANEEINETDIVYRLLGQYLNLATINSNLKDIKVPSLGFNVEVKYLRNFKSECGYSSKITWKEMDKDFEWLSKSIQNGQKGKSAFIIGWFNVYSYLGEIVQLGQRVGGYPKVNPSRIKCFPFVNQNSIYTSKTFFEYNLAFKELEVPYYNDMQCYFVGKENNLFNMVIYY